MSNEILSQEEIDALLGAMDKGEVDLETDATAAETEAYDITSQEVNMRDEFDALAEVYEKFTRRAKATFEAWLQTSVEFQLGSRVWSSMVISSRHIPDQPDLEFFP